MLPLQWGAGSIPGQGTKIPHAAQHDQKAKKKKGQRRQRGPTGASPTASCLQRHLQQAERDGESRQHGNALFPPSTTDGWCVAGAWSEEQMGDVSPDSVCHWAQVLQDYGELCLHVNTHTLVAACKMRTSRDKNWTWNSFIILRVLP